MTPADRIADLVAHYVRAGLASRPRRIPRAQYPMLLESEYAAQLVAFVSEWRAAVRSLIDDLPSILHEARRDSARFDSPTRTRTARDAVRSTVERVPLTAARSARRAAEQQKKQFAKQTKAALGVELQTHDPGLDKRIQHFVTENAAALQRLGDDTVNAIESIVARAYTSGQSTEEVAQEIMKRLDIAERGARRIARNQMGRLYAQVTRMRHKEVGVLVFRWHTQEDSRVRPSHRVKNKKLFPYEGSRAPSFFPGEESECRCWEEPVFDELKEKVRKLLGKGRRRAA